jgi:MYXO-CTERM domain-containing protein
VVTGAITNGTGTVAVTKSNSSVWTLTGANTHTGATTVSAGTLKVGSAVAFTGTGALVLSGTGVLDLNGYDVAFSGNVPTGVATNLITDNSAGTGTSVLTFRQSTNNGITTAAQITDGPSRKLGILLVNGNGAQQFTNAGNTFSGGITLLHQTNGTRLQVATVPTYSFVSGVLTAGPYGTGPITVGQAATDKAGIFVSAMDATIANPIVANTTLGTDRVGTFRIDATGLTLSGLLTAGASDLALSTNGTGSAILTGRLTGSNGLRLLSHGAGGTSLTVTLAGAAGTNDYAGNTTINDNPQSGRTYTLDLGAPDQIPNGAGKGNVVVNTNGTGTGSLRLQGFSETINGLSGSGTVTNTVAGESVLTLGDNDATAGFSGTITESVGTVRLVKIGAGTQTLSGLSTYSGGTAVNAGTLTIGVQGTQTGSAVGFNKEVTVADGATLRMTQTDGLGYYGANPSSLIIRGTMTIATGKHASVGSFGLTLDGGRITAEGVGSGEGNYIFDGTVTTLAHANSAVIDAGSIKLRNGATANQSVTFNVADGAAATDLLVSSALTNGSGVNGLTKAGNGTLVLSGASTYSGNTLFGTAVGTSTGVLRLAGNGALGSGKLVINNGASDTGTVELTGGITLSNNIDFFGRGNSGTAAIIRNVSGDNVLSGVLAGSYNGANYNFHSDAGTLTITNRITTNSGGRTLNLRGAGAIRISGVIEDGTGGMNVRTLDGGTYVLSGANTYTGTTTVNGGTLRVSSLGTGGGGSSLGNSALTAGNLLLNGAVTLDYAGSGEETARGFTVSGSGLRIAASGTGALKFTSAAPIAFAADGNAARALRLGGTNTGDNTFGASLSGSPEEADKIKQLTKDDVGTWIVDGPANRFRSDLRVDVNDGILGFTSGALDTTDDGVIAIGHGATLRWEAGNTDDLSGRILIADGATATIAVAAGTVDFASGFQLGANKSGLLIKSGNGALKLTASQEVSRITVNQGLLEIASGTTIGAVTVNQGGILGGKGSAGAVTVASGGIVSPGSSPGVLTHAGLSLSGGSVIDWEVLDARGSAGIGYDRLVVTGELDLTGAAPGNKVVLKITSLSGLNSFGDALNFDPPAGVGSIRTFQFGQAGSLRLNDGQNISDVFAFDVSDFTYSDGSSSNAGLWSINWNSASGAITLTAVPEPSTYGLGLGALALAAAALRRRRRPALQV